MSQAPMSRPPEATRIAGCRSCGGTRLVPVLSLGETPLANALVAPEDLDAPEPRYPLELVFCAGCTLLQLTVSVRPDLMFSRYPYFSSVSESFTAAARALAARLVVERGLGAGSQVVEVASNDGYLLQGYQAHGVLVLGIDPAANVARAAIAKGVPTRIAFFGRDLAESLAAEGIAADVIHASNVLAHVPDLNGVVAGMKRLLKPGGLCVIEVPYARDFVEKCEFDTIYHEHLCYFSGTALAALFARHGLVLADVETTPFHGGTLRAFAAHAGTAPGAAADALLAEEARLGMASAPYYADFAARVERLTATLAALLRRLKGGGATIAAYGASAKGATLLNYAGLGPDVIDFVADRAPAKQGLHAPGTKLPIVPPERLVEAMPDYTLLLTWNFAEEIMAQQAAYRDAGGRFVVPVPEVRIV